MSTISLRLPDSLHKKVRELAKSEDVSINQLIATALAEKMSALMTVDYLRERGALGDRAKYEAALGKVRNVEPDEGDELPGPAKGSHDHPLPSGSACSLRIDERREGGDGAPPAPRPPRHPPPRGITVREDKEFRRILIFPPATEPANGRWRPDSQGILVFPFRTTPRRSRPGAPRPRAPERRGWS